MMAKEKSGTEKILLEDKTFGMRLYDEKASLAFLEFLFILFNVDWKSSLEKDDQDIVKIDPVTGPSHLVLRCLVFNNGVLSRCESWDDWERTFKAQFEGEKFFPADWNADYLKKAFRDSKEGFENFARVVRLVRGGSFTAAQAGSDSWANRFLFPWSSAQVYPDIDPKGSDANATIYCKRHFFTHNGAIAFLMLLHAEKCRELFEEIENRFKTERVNSLMTKLCAALEGDWKVRHPVTLSSGSRLPDTFVSSETSLRRADLLCEDLLRLLRLKLKIEDLVDPMTRLMGLHLLCYFIETARSSTDDPRLAKNGRPFFLCEVIRKEYSAIRALSRRCFQQNDNLGLEVLRIGLDRRLEAVYRSSDKEEGRLKAFQKLDITAGEFKNTCAELIREGKKKELQERMEEALEDKYRKHLGKFLRTMGSSIGLSTNLFTNAYRYAPSDELIAAVTLANVDQSRLPLDQFLRKLVEKYGLIFGQEGLEYLPEELQPDQNHLKKNRELLVKRLHALGVLAHLSDGCEYVNNHYL